MQTALAELRALLPTWAFAVLLPVPVATLWADGSGRAFAYAYLFLGNAVVAAESFRSGRHADTPEHWRIKVSALALAAAASALVFTAFVWAMNGEPDPTVPVLAGLAVVPAVCCTPYLTLATGQPFAAVLFTVFLLGAVKMAGCAVVRVVYGPTALADGRMTLPWEDPNLLVGLCLTGALACSALLYLLGRREYLAAPIEEHVQ